MRDIGSLDFKWAEKVTDNKNAQIRERKWAKAAAAGNENVARLSPFQIAAIP